MSRFAFAEPITEPNPTEPEPTEPELDPALGEQLGDEIVLASVRTQRVARAHGSVKAFPGVISARAWQATGRVD